MAIDGKQKQQLELKDKLDSSGKYKSSGKLTPRAALWMAIMRSSYSTAAMKMGMTLQRDISHTSFIAWEKRAAAALLAYSKQCYIQYELLFKKPVLDRTNRWY